MSDDELVVTVVAVVVGPILWSAALLRLARMGSFRRDRTGVGALAAALAACSVFIVAVLRTAGSADVRQAPGYVFMYVVLGLAWLRIAEGLFAFAGLSVRDDLVERRNRAAVPALLGAMAGVAFCYAGGNIGDGPGWWVVLFSAGLATASLFAAWLLLGAFGSGVDALTIDRDPAAGVRLGAFLASSGLVLGRAVAGDWDSAAATIRDAANALPASVLILVTAITIERLARPTAQQPHAPMFVFGVLPAVLFFFIAMLFVSAMGWPA